MSPCLVSSCRNGFVSMQHGYCKVVVSMHAVMVSDQIHAVDIGYRHCSNQQVLG